MSPANMPCCGENVFDACKYLMLQRECFCRLEKSHASEKMFLSPANTSCCGETVFVAWKYAMLRRECFYRLQIPMLRRDFFVTGLPKANITCCGETVCVACKYPMLRKDCFCNRLTQANATCCGGRTIFVTRKYPMLQRDCFCRLEICHAPGRLFYRLQMLYLCFLKFKV